jgi:hypothetical protein
MEITGYPGARYSLERLYVQSIAYNRLTILPASDIRWVGAFQRDEIVKSVLLDEGELARLRDIRYFTVLFSSPQRECSSQL